MAEDTQTPTPIKTDWERGKDALEAILKWVPIEKVEKLSKKINDPAFRKSMQYKIFINSL